MLDHTVSQIIHQDNRYPETRTQITIQTPDGAGIGMFPMRIEADDIKELDRLLFTHTDCTDTDAAGTANEFADLWNAGAYRAAIRLLPESTTVTLTSELDLSMWANDAENVILAMSTITAGDLEERDRETGRTTSPDVRARQTSIIRRYDEDDERNDAVIDAARAEAEQAADKTNATIPPDDATTLMRSTITIGDVREYWREHDMNPADQPERFRRHLDEIRLYDNGYVKTDREHDIIDALTPTR